ncbi:MAG TPA: SDR family NAD(P)-dependent oxidoreductase [Candidatus Limnocylindria bacterium]|nr:SDR family NAD(P)-dependent oxidoreductase [Candidatus Limnocylindria bacterium]
MTDEFDLSGRVGFVTGGASGLGLAFGEVLATRGARVVLADIDEAGVEREAARLRAAGCDAEAVVLDVFDLPRIRSVVDDVVARHGALDVCFANAGISAGTGPFTEAGALTNVSLDAFERVLRINVTSVFATMQAAAVHMRARKRGRIIVTSSIGGMKSEPMVGYAYAASKAALNNLVRHAAVELARDNVLVTAIAPGPFRTNIANGRLHKDPSVEKAFAQDVPLGRIGEVEEIKGLALLLASDASSFLTGAVIPIDGGATAW